MNIAEHFKSQVEQYLETSGMKPTAFGMQAVNDPSFVARLQSGRNCKVETIDRVLTWMQDNPPEQAND